MMKRAPIMMFGLILVCFYAGELFAQDPPKKFGDIDMQNLEMARFELDTNAAAVVLFDYGETEFIVSTSNLQIRFRQHRRVKILDSEAFDMADVSITHYRGGRLANFKAATYNVAGGKMVTSKVDKKSIFSEKLSDDLTASKFALTDIKEGSIIEYTYYVDVGNYYRLNTWHFQEDIPVIYSEYNAIVPEWFTYKELMSGYHSLSQNSKNSQSIGTIGGTHYRYVAENLPAFIEEPYLDARTNYISKIEFELAVINIPGRMFEEVLGSYESVNKDYLESSYVYGRLKENDFYIDYVSKIGAGKTGMEKAVAIYDHVRDNVKWTGRTSTGASNSMKKVIDEGEGTSGEINLLLVTLLRNAGFTSNPVMYSTRSNGMLHPVYAIVSRFNDVLASVSIDNKEYLLDGTDAMAPFNQLPFRSLNGSGLMITPTRSRWVELAGVGIKYMNTSGTLKLNEDGSVEGTVVESKKGYDALDLRDRINNDGEDKYVDSRQEDNPDWTINSYEFEGLSDVSVPTKETAEVEIIGAGESLGNIIYVNPLMADRMETNPFKLENRTYPVDYGCKQSRMWYFMIDIPEGYVVDELPEPAAFGLPEKSASFQYTVSQVGDKIQVVSRMNINKVKFLPSEYQMLKQFYSLIVDKQSETIVLKKNT